MKKKKVNEQVSVKDQQDLIELARADLVSFSRWPLGYEQDTELWKCQVEWQELIQESYEAKQREPLPV